MAFEAFVSKSRIYKFMECSKKPVNRLLIPWDWKGDHYPVQCISGMHMSFEDPLQKGGLCYCVCTSHNLMSWIVYTDAFVCNRMFHDVAQTRSVT